MNWLIILALISLLAGIVTGILGLKSMRSKSYPQAEISWKQEPLPLWRYETVNMIVLSLHSLGLICMALILVINLVLNWDNSFLPALESLDSTRPVSRIVGLLAMAFTTFTSSVLIPFHFLQQWIRPAAYGINKDGLLYGGSQVHWNSFSHYELGPEDGLISLHSGYSPSLRNWVLHPPVESFSGVLALIQHNLPSMPPNADDMDWKHSPLTLLVTMIALLLAALLPALWGLTQNRFWVWGYCFAAFFIVQDLGIRLLTLFDGRTKKSDQATSMPSA